MGYFAQPGAKSLPHGQLSFPGMCLDSLCEFPNPDPHCESVRSVIFEQTFFTQGDINISIQSPNTVGNSMQDFKYMTLQTDNHFPPPKCFCYNIYIYLTLDMGPDGNSLCTLENTSSSFAKASAPLKHQTKILHDPLTSQVRPFNFLHLNPK